MKKLFLILVSIFVFASVGYAWDQGNWDDVKVPYALKTAAPTVNDADYPVPFLWTDTTNDKQYILIDNTPGAAVWQEVLYAGGAIGADLIPDTDNTYDLGSSSKEWKDLYVDGTANLDNTDIDGTVSIQPSTDSTTAVQVLDADGGDPVLNVDTTNERVGIGTGSPGAKLQTESANQTLTGNVADTNASSKHQIAAYTTDVQAADTGASLGLGGQYTDAGNTYLTFGAIAGRKENSTTGNGLGYLSFYSANAGLNERMRIDSSGNVGISETSPDELLHITSGTNAKPVVKIENTNTNDNGPILEFNKSTTDEADDDTIGVIDFNGMDSGSNETGYVRMRAYASDVTAGDEGGKLEFTLMAGGTDGTAGTKNLLSIGGEDVAGGTEAEVVINEDGIDANTRIEASGQANALFVEGSSGNVGIGTGSPANNLHISESGSGAVYSMFTNDSTGTTGSDGFKIGINGSEQGVIEVQEANSLHLGVDSSIDMTIAPGGNVGIGTTSPREELSVYGATEIHQTYGENDAILYFTADDDTSSPDVVNTGRIESLVYDWGVNDLKSKLQFYTMNANAETGPHMTINQIGNVGIGDTSPDFKLEVAGTIGLQEVADAIADEAGTGQIWVHDSTPNELWFTDDAGTDTQISPHPLDAPAELYQNGPGLDWMGKRVQHYLGIIFWQARDGVITEETFAAYNARRKDVPGHVDLVKRDWDKIQLAELKKQKRLEGIDIEEEEVLPKDAFEQVEIMEEVDDGVDVKYEYGKDKNGKVVVKEVLIPKKKQQGTGKFEERLKPGISFNEKTGKFVRAAYHRELTTEEVEALNLKAPPMPGWMQTWKDKNDPQTP